MWVSCPQTALLKAVQIVGRAISTRTTMPILGYVLMETQKDGIKLTATDLELAMQVEVAATVTQGGQVRRNGRRSVGIAKSAAPGSRAAEDRGDCTGEGDAGTGARAGGRGGCGAAEDGRQPAGLYRAGSTRVLPFDQRAVSELPTGHPAGI